MESFQEIQTKIDDFVVSKDLVQSYKLQRIKDALNKLGNPQNKIKTIHIAGTSGKTSTSYLISSGLTSLGYKTGLTVSPHVLEMNERLQINNLPVPEKVFSQAMSDFIDKLNHLDIKVTYFELFVAFTYSYFAEENVDYAVIETGVGGKYDATNTINNSDKVCVLTDIGFDHMSVLGNTIEQITDQKAGIIQTNNQVFMNEQPKTIEEFIEKITEAKHAKITVNSQETIEKYKNQFGFDRNQTLAWVTINKIFKLNPPKKEKLKNAIKNTKIPGRREIIHLQNGKILILDGAHNAQKIKYFVDSIEKKDSQKITVLYGAIERKRSSIPEIANCISKIADEIIICGFKTYKQDQDAQPINSAEIAEYFQDKERVIVEEDSKKAYKKLIESDANICIVTGSLFLVSAIKKLI